MATKVVYTVFVCEYLMAHKEKLIGYILVEMAHSKYWHKWSCEYLKGSYSIFKSFNTAMPTYKN